MYSLKNIIIKNFKNYMSYLSSVYVRSLNDWLNVFYFSDYYFFFEITTLKLIYTSAILIVVYLNMNYYIVLESSYYIGTIITWNFSFLNKFIWNNGFLNFFKNLFLNCSYNKQRFFNIHKEIRKKNFKINRNN